MQNLFTPPKTCSGSLLGVNGNAIALVGSFKRFAKADGWTPVEIETVCKEAMNGDYDHLLTTLTLHMDD